jgi:hypothetical protein
VVVDNTKYAVTATDMKQAKDDAILYLKKLIANPRPVFHQGDEDLGEPDYWSTPPWTTEQLADFNSEIAAINKLSY